MPTRKTSIIRKILFLLAVFILFLICLELGLRAAGSLYLAWHSRNAPISAHDNLNKTVTKAKINLVCLGDSYTCGTDVNFGENYPSRLERILNQHFGENTCKVINQGIPGDNSSKCLRRFQENENSLPPVDFVLTAIGMNNCWNRHLAYSHLPESKKNVKNKLKSIIYKLRISNLLKIKEPYDPDLDERLDIPFIPMHTLENETRSSPWLTKWLLSDLEEIRKISTSLGAQPVLVEYWEAYPYVRKAYFTIRDSPDWEYVSATQFGLDPDADVSHLLTADNWHPNSKGYELLAGLVAKKLIPLIKMKLDQKDRPPEN